MENSVSEHAVIGSHSTGSQDASTIRFESPFISSQLGSTIISLVGLMFKHNLDLSLISVNDQQIREGREFPLLNNICPHSQRSETRRCSTKVSDIGFLNTYLDVGA